MISASQLVMLAGASGALMLAAGNLRRFGLSLEVRLWMALVWLLVIIALAQIGAHLPPGRFDG